VASKGKKKTTMAKLARESKLRERQADKKAKKDARKNAPADDPDELAQPPADEAAEVTEPEPVAADVGTPAEA
jgi:hypothetical protein